jgi:hypothetical protein
MQKIERNFLAQAHVAGGSNKGGTSTATASSPVTIDASNLTIPAGSTVYIKIDNGATAIASS